MTKISELVNEVNNCYNNSGCGDKMSYRNDPKFSDRQVWENSADPDQTAPRVYTVCNAICILWVHYSMVKPPCSNLIMITANFRVSEFFVFLW